VTRLDTKEKVLERLLPCFLTSLSKAQPTMTTVADGMPLHRQLVTSLLLLVVHQRANGFNSGRLLVG
jgi:hypothetical protein